MLNTSIETRGDIQIFRLEGRVDSVTAKGLEEAFLQNVQAGHKYFVADLAEVKYVSSAGLRVFLVVAKRLKPVGGNLRLAALNQTIREVFEISGFLKLFEILDNADNIG